jgi:hypothetical protein
MKLIIKEYLTSLKERGELDVILPDLLSQMGLHVFSKPSRGTRQYGVDIAAVGEVEGELKKVFLLSAKSGNLGRKDWDGGSPQDLRPSLNEIIDVYIPTHLPPEYKNLPIEICICIGGNVEESVRQNLSGYEDAKKTEKINIVEWDGDHLAAWIEKYFLQENLLPKEVRPSLRKSLALLEEPQVSFAHFANLIKRLIHAEAYNNSQVLIILRQMNICLWILFAWAREANNLESSYLAAELVLLHAWEISKKHLPKQSKVATAGTIMSAFFSILNTYQTISREYIAKLLHHTRKRHGLSSAVHPSSALDINLKLFEMLGRLSIVGLWTKWNYDQSGEEMQENHAQEIEVLSNHLKQLIMNNPALFLPIKDDQAIDISLAILFLSFQEKDEEDIINWLSQILDRAIFSYKTHGCYPCIHRDYFTLLDHPERQDNDYRQEATSGSILYPMIGLWAALLKKEELYKKVQLAKEKYLSHCNFQFWYPGESTEKHLYENDEIHGAVFSQVPIEQDADTFLKFVWDECEHSDAFKKLSCVETGLWPVLLVACCHYRLPVPVDFTLGYRNSR